MRLSRSTLLRCLATASFLWLGGYALPARADNKAEAEIAAEVATSGQLAKGDTRMSCDQIASEIVELDRIIRTARTTRKNSDNTGTGVSVAKTVGSFLVGSLGGVIGIVAVGALAGEVAENSGEEAAAIEENAEERQNRLAGVFEGKGCEGELAMTVDKTEDVANIEPAAGTQAQDTTPRKPHYND